MTVDRPFGVRYTRDVGPHQLGVRVSLRRRLPDGRLSDVLGVLQSWTGGTLAVRRRDGAVVSVPERDVVAIKQVPPPPERR